MSGRALIVVAGMLGLLAAGGNALTVSAGEHAASGAAAPDFSVTSLTGATHTLSRLTSEKDLIIVNFWGLRCGACIEEIPYLNEIHGRYKDRVAMLGVNVDAIDGATLKDMMKAGSLDIKYEVVPDPDLKIVDLFHMTAAPLTVLIDKSRNVIYRHENFEPGDEVELNRRVAQSLAK